MNIIHILILEYLYKLINKEDLIDLANDIYERNMNYHEYIFEWITENSDYFNEEYLLYLIKKDLELEVILKEEIILHQKSILNKLINFYNSDLDEKIINSLYKIIKCKGILFEYSTNDFNDTELTLIYDYENKIRNEYRFELFKESKIKDIIKLLNN